RRRGIILRILIVYLEVLPAGHGPCTQDVVISGAADWSLTCFLNAGREYMRRYFSALLLSGALLAPVAVRAADDEHRDRERDHRFYDRSKRDYHEWNEREDRAYRRYLQERRRDYRDFTKAHRKDQDDYWKWRHHHRDD